jgi:hypothetical protein
LQRAVPEIDAVLCLDFVNAFTQSPTDSIRLAQLVCRPGKRAAKLSRYVSGKLMPAFSRTTGIPIRKGYTLERLHQNWVTDQHGKFERYEAKVDLNRVTSP